MDTRLIERPSQETLEIIENRSRLSFKNKKPGALGLVQDKVVKMVCAADIVEKISGVEMEDIQGSYPRNFITLVIVGEMADVNEALRQIQARIDEMKNF